MFGYAKINKGELKFKEYNLYRAYYCGLCEVLHKDYGISSKFLLNYDCTFIAMLLSLSYNEEPVVCKSGCTFNPLGKKLPVVKRSRALEFAAALNVLLAYESLSDGWQDDRNVIKGAGKSIFKRARDKARKKYPEMHKCIMNGLFELHEAEAQSVADIDIPANASASILSDAVATFDAGSVSKAQDECNSESSGKADEWEATRKLVFVLCDNIGRFVYVADAWQDRKRDAGKGSYNPINLTGASKERVTNILYFCLANACNAYELLEPIDKSDSPLCAVIRNVLECGCCDVTEAVVNDRYKIRKKTGGSIDNPDNAAGDSKKENSMQDR